MIRTVFPGQVSGFLKAPPSKSMAQRAIAVASLIYAKSTISMGTPCDDIKSAINCSTGLGSIVQENDLGITIQGRAKPILGKLDCGEAGLCIRMFSSVAAVFDSPIVLEAKGSLLARPMNMIEESLKKLGVCVETNNGFAPIKINGPFKSTEVTVDASTSSQFLTGLLISLCFCDGNYKVHAPLIKSIPYVQMTIDLLEQVGKKVFVNDSFDTFEINNNSNVGGFEYQVPGDWSGASFLLVAGAIAGNVSVEGLDLKSSQADLKILEALKDCGANLNTHSSKVEVKKTGLCGFNFDATHCPDLFPPLIALAVNCKGISRIKGVHRLKVKESNREKALVQEFGKLGAVIGVENDEMVVTGGALKGTRVCSHNDHRIAMAAATAALCAKEPVEIENFNCINKSYPDYFEDMIKLGAKIE